MTDTYKILGQGLGGDTTPRAGVAQDSLLYTVPSGKQASISTVSITNAGTSSADYSLAVVKAGDTDAYTTIPNVVTGTETAFAFSWETLAYTTDGLTWSAKVSKWPTNNFWSSVVYGGGRLVAISAENGASISSSDDGDSWSTGQLVAGNYGFAQDTLLYGNGIFLTFSYYGETSYTSTDGISWQSHTPNYALGRSRGTTSAVYAFGYFFRGHQDYNEFYRSTDGITWETIGQAGIGTLRGTHIFFVNNTLIIKTSGITGLTVDYYSLDGNSWSTAPIMAAGNLSYSFNSMMAFGNGTYVSVAYSGTGYTVQTKTDIAASWSTSSAISYSNPGYDYGGWYPWQYLTFINNKFLLSGFYGYTATSSAGVTWTNSSVEQGVLASQPPRLTSNVIKDARTTADETALLFTDKNTLVPTRALATGSSEEIKGGITLSSGDQLRLRSTSSSVIGHVYGAEIA